jgi:hypothetical protein
MPDHRADAWPVRTYSAAAAILAEREPVLRRLIEQAGPARLRALHRKPFRRASPGDRLSTAGWRRSKRFKAA